MKKYIRNIQAFATVLLLALAPLQAHATPLTSDITVFSFDLSQGLNGTQYAAIRFTVHFSTSDPIDTATDVMQTYVYGAENGQDLIQIRQDTDHPTSFTNGGTQYGPSQTANPIFDAMLDGKFSFGLSMRSGSADLISFDACGVSAAGALTCQTELAATVPEPDSLSLIGLGVLGLATIRRRTLIHAIAKGIKTGF